MDEMKISSKFTRMLLSKLAKGVLHKKLGYDIDIQLNELNASISDESLAYIVYIADNIAAFADRRTRENTRSEEHTSELQSR